MKPVLALISDADVLILTPKGERELHEPGTRLTSAQLESLVLIDGHVNIAEILRCAGKSAPDVTRDILADLVIKGLTHIKSNTEADLFDPGNFFSAGSLQSSLINPDDHTLSKANANTAFLQHNGYCVNFASPSVEGGNRDSSRKFTVLIIDDDPNISHVLQLYLKLEGFETNVAANREEILSALRNPKLPDLVLLDVMLGPDLDGFDILARIRQHPHLKKLPIIMLTAKASRESVIKGILGGANGYVTKPFEMHPLVRGVRTVLGLDIDKKIQDWDYSL
ncbi:MAG: response regulator [Gammaproteobacteria bacterium]